MVKSAGTIKQINRAPVANIHSNIRGEDFRFLGGGWFDIDRFAWIEVLFPFTDRMDHGKIGRAMRSDRKSRYENDLLSRLDVGFVKHSFFDAV